MRLLVFFLFSSLSAYAWPPTFGAEFTFTNEELIRSSKPNADGVFVINTAEIKAARTAFVKKVKATCLVRTQPKCVVEAKKKGYRADSPYEYYVKYEDGWWFKVSADPGVLEVQTKPSTVEELKKIESRMQKDIFDQMWRIGLAPHATIGGGHIHMGLKSAFDGDPELFLAYLLDVFNHPELSTGILGHYFNNARVLATAPPEVRQNLLLIIEEFKRGKNRNIYALAEKIQKTLYAHIPTLSGGWEDTAKFVDLNLKRVNEEMSEAYQTVENRAPRPQKTAHEFILETQMMHSRLEYLKKSPKSHLEYIFKDPKASMAEKIAWFQQLIYETGLNWEEYRLLMPEKYQKMAPAVTTLQSLNWHDPSGSVCEQYFEADAWEIDLEAMAEP